MAPISLKKGKIDEITQKLIQSITKLEDGSENFKISLEFAVSNFRFHKFLDVNPFDVNRKLSGLRDKFIIHCQQQRAEQLILLKEKFLSNPYSTTELAENSDDHYGMLSLLLNLSDSPIRSSFVLTNKETIEEEDDINWTEYLLEGEEKLENGIYITEDQRIALEESDEEALFISSDDVIKVEQKNVELDSVLELSNSASADFENHQKDLLWFRQNIITQYWKNCMSYSTLLKSGHFLEDLTEFTSSTLQVSLPGSQICTHLSETIIIREILWMLQGAEATFLFHYVNDQVMVKNDSTIGHTSEEALCNFLQTAAKSGTKLQHLRQYVKKVCDTKSFQLKTCRAFGFAIHSFLKVMNKELSDIETAISKKIKIYTLLTLMDSVRPMIKNIDLVYNLFHECVHEEECEKKSHGELMVHIINTQYQTVCKLDSLGHAYRTQLGVVLHLFLETIRPCLVDLGTWITEGKLPSVSPDEFFIQMNQAVDVSDADIWKNLYHVNSNEKTGPVKYVIPSFFLESAMKILLAGKSYGLLEQAKSNKGTLVSIPFDEEFLHKFSKNVNIPSGNSCPDKQKNSKDSSVELSLTENEQSLLLADNFRVIFLNFYEILCNKDVEEQTAENSEDIGRSNFAEFGNQSPLKFLFEKTINNLIEKRYCEASKLVLSMLNEKFQLNKHISVMKNFFLMEAGDIMSLFCLEVFMKLRNKETWQNTSYLTYELHESLMFRFPELTTKLTAGVTPMSEVQNIDASSNIQSIGRIFLHYRLEWPMTIIFDNKALERYNAIFSFLLQVKHALWCLEQLRLRDLLVNNTETGIELAGKRQKLYILRMRLMHFIQGFHVYLMTRILHSSGLELQNCLSKAKDLEDVISAHQGFLDKIYDRCLLSQKVGFAKEAITRILNLCTNFQTQWDKGLLMIHDGDLNLIENEFLKCSHFIQSFLRNLIKRGSFPHLELLAMSLKW